jgi:hypothetical protein
VRDCSGNPGGERSGLRNCSVKPDPEGHALILFLLHIFDFMPLILFLLLLLERFLRATMPENAKLWPTDISDASESLK